MTVFEEFLSQHSGSNVRIKIYLKPTNNQDNHSANSKSQNIMLSGKVKSFDADGIWLIDKECYVSTDSIKSMKPDTSY